MCSAGSEAGHDPAYAASNALACGPVGQIAVLRHLKRAQNRGGHAPGARHRERHGRIEIRTVRARRHELATGIVEVEILFTYR